MSAPKRTPRPEPLPDQATVPPEAVNAEESTTSSTPTTAHAPTTSPAPVTTSRRTTPTSSPVAPPTSVTAPPTTQPPFRPYDPNPLHPTWMVDTTFAAAGTLIEPFGPHGDLPYAMVLQPDGKIVVAGSLSIDPMGGVQIHAVVLRLNSDGTRDATFGDDGLVTWDMGRNTHVDAMALQPDGKILVSGTLSADGIYAGGLRRLLPDGRPDPLFGNGGLVTTGIHDGKGLALEPDGKIVVAGWDPKPELGVSLARFSTAGELDRTFGTDGRARVPGLAGQQHSDTPKALARLDDGSFMVVGLRWTVGASSKDTLTIRVLPDGRLDTQYGAAGIKVFDFGGFESGMGVLSDTGGRAVIGVGVGGGTPQVIARVLPTGELDASFGEGGLIHVEATLTAIGRAPDGRIVVGMAGSLARISRYGADGQLDPSLEGRLYRSPLGDGSHSPIAVAVDPAGRIMYAGFKFRYNNPASLPGLGDIVWFVERVLPPDSDLTRRRRSRVRLNLSADSWWGSGQPPCLSGARRRRTARAAGRNSRSSGSKRHTTRA